MIDPAWQRHITRRGFVAAGAATAFLAACGGSTEADKEDEGDSIKETAQKVGGTLFYYNWADYVNPKTYKAFTKDTGVDIKKDFYVSNEELQVKLQGGARGFDLVAPTGYMVQILADANQLEPIDYSKLPNV